MSIRDVITLFNDFLYRRADSRRERAKVTVNDQIGISGNHNKRAAKIIRDGRKKARFCVNGGFQVLVQRCQRFGFRLPFLM